MIDAGRSATAPPGSPPLATLPVGSVRISLRNQLAHDPLELCSDSRSASAASVPWESGISSFASPPRDPPLSEEKDGVSVDTGHVRTYLQLTRRPLLSRTISVVPSCRRQQNRADPSESRICRKMPRLPTDRCTRSCATMILWGSRTKH